MNTRKDPLNSYLPLSDLILSLVFFASLDALTPAVVPADTVPLQPFGLQVRQIENALDYLGEPLSLPEQQQINQAVATRTRRLLLGRSNRFSTNTPWRLWRSIRKAA